MKRPPRNRGGDGGRWPLAALGALAWLTAAATPAPAHEPPDPPTEPAARPNDYQSVRVLRTTNKAQLNRYVPVAYEFHHVNPFAVVRFLRRPAEMEEGAFFTFMAPDGKSGVAVLAVPEYQIPYYDKLVAMIDRPNLTSNDGTERVYRQLKHRRASALTGSPTLDDLGFIDTFRSYLTGDGTSIVVDPEQNAVFYQDAPSGAKMLTHALDEFLDKPTPQAIVSVKVYEINSDNQNRIGQDYIAWKNGPGSSLFALGAFAETGDVDVVTGSGRTLDPVNGLNRLPIDNSDFQSDGVNFAYRYETSSAFFDFVVTRSHAKLLNSARIAILNSRVGRVTAGDQILYYAVETTDPSGIRGSTPLSTTAAQRVVIPGRIDTADAARSDNPALKDPNFIATEKFIPTNVPQTDSILVKADVGLELDLRALISGKGADIKASGWVSDFNGFDDRGFPRINSRRFNSNFRLAECEETILGGLVREVEVKSANKPPFIGDLPIIGFLFSGEQTKRTRSEIVISIRLDRIDRFQPGGEPGGVTAEELDIIEDAEEIIPPDLPEDLEPEPEDGEPAPGEAVVPGAEPPPGGITLPDAPGGASVPPAPAH